MLRLLRAQDIREVVALDGVEQQRVGEMVPATGVAEDGDLALPLEAKPTLLEDGVAHFPQDFAALLRQVRAPEKIGVGATQGLEAAGPRGWRGKNGCSNSGGEIRALHDLTHRLRVWRDQGRRANAGLRHAIVPAGLSIPDLAIADAWLVSRG